MGPFQLLRWIRQLRVGPATKREKQTFRRVCRSYLALELLEARLTPTVNVATPGVWNDAANNLALIGTLRDDSPTVNPSYTATVSWGDNTTTNPIVQFTLDSTVPVAGGDLSDQHTYALPGLYTVTLSVTNAAGDTGSASVMVTVSAPL